MYDIIIKSGTIIDGTTFPRFKADIGIKNGVITKVGQIDDADAKQVVDASGLIVAPGYIDCHTHYDAQIHWDPYCSNSGENGVTTVVAGNCGFGFAPCRPADRERAMLMMENTEQVPYEQMKAALPWTWESFPQFMDHLRTLPKGVNFMMYLPLNPLMIYVMGLDAAKTRRATDAELAQMRQLIVEAMEAGAAGIALSHLQDNNGHTDYDGSPMPTDTMYRDDAIELARALKTVNAGTIQILSHVPGIFDDKELAAEMQIASGRPVILNVALSTAVIKKCYQPLLDWAHGQVDQGREIFVQSFVQRSWSEFNLIDFNLNDAVEEWRDISKLPTIEAKLAKIADPAHRALMKERYDTSRLMTGSGPVEELTLTVAKGSDELAPFIGKTVGEIAKLRGQDPLDVMFDICLETGGWADFQTAVNSGGDVVEAADLISDPLVMAGSSDGGAHSKFYCGGHWATELLVTLGRDGKLISLEDLHYRFAWQPARVMGLSGRGAIMEGYAADIVVYDLAAIDVSAASYEMRFDQPEGDWRRYFPTSGYRYILVNGAVTFVDGEPTGALSGLILPSADGVGTALLAAE